MNRIILFLLLFVLVPILAVAHDFTVDGIYYNRNGNKATVTFRGTSFSQYSNEYTGEVIIPENVTYNSITYSVTTIGDDAFHYCSGLTSVTIPNSITSIGNSAFHYCFGLTSVTIPNSVTSIGDWAFYNCNGITNFEIPNSVTNIGIDAFSGTLWYANQPEGIVYAGQVVYKYKGTMPSGTNISLNESTLGIASSAFANCTGLLSIRIPNSIAHIGLGAFSGCSELTEFIVESDNQFYDSRNNCNAIIETASNSLIAGCKSSFIPYSVTSIAERSFYKCYGLSHIHIPQSVTYIGDYAFNECTGLKSIVFPSSVNSTGSYIFGNCFGLRIVEIPITSTCINGSTFYNPRYSTLFISGDGDWQANGINGDPANAVLYIGKEVTGIKGLRTPTRSDVYCYATNPPTCDNNTFSNYSCTLHVPAASLAAYFTAEYWRNFYNIIGDAVEPIDITISKESINLQIEDEPITLSATVYPANATPNDVIWISTNPSVATVDDDGIVTAVGSGECNVIAQCLNKQAICHVVVKDESVSISLDLQEAMLQPNHMLILTPSCTPVIPYLSVTSSNPTVAAARLMSGQVQVVGIKEGTTTITVGSVDGTAIPATCLVTVYTEPGDMNCDGFVNISDVTLLIDYLLSGDGSLLNTKNADVNGDDCINISDVTTLIDILLRDN